MAEINDFYIAKNIDFRMPRLTKEQCIELANDYHHNNDNAALALIAYRCRHKMHGGQRVGPCNIKALRALVAKFSRMGSVDDAPRSG